MKSRTAWGFVFGPMPTAAILFLIFVFAGFWIGVLAAVFALAVSYAVALTLGVVTHMGLVKLGATRWWAYVGAGFLIGTLGPYLISLAVGGNRPWELPATALFCGPMGIANAIAFWLIARPDRPAQANTEEE